MHIILAMRDGTRVQPLPALVTRFCDELSATIGSQLEVPGASVNYTLWDQFELLQPKDVNRTLLVVRPTMCPLDPCPTWVIKSSRRGLTELVQGVCGASLWEEDMPITLKETGCGPS